LEDIADEKVREKFLQNAPVKNPSRQDGVNPMVKDDDTNDLLKTNNGR
jgi:hypothetical protein